MTSTKGGGKGGFFYSLGKTLVLKNAKIITPMRVINNGILIVRDGKIFAVGSEKEIRLLRGVEVINVANKYLASGFIDIHLHGGGEADVMDTTEEAVEKISIAHAKGGSTSIVLTTLTASMDDIMKAVKVIGLTKRSILPGAPSFRRPYRRAIFFYGAKRDTESKVSKRAKTRRVFEVFG